MIQLILRGHSAPALSKGSGAKTGLRWLIVETKTLDYGIFIAGAIAVSLALSSCSMLVAGIVGAAVTPIVQPMVDRALHELDLDWVDPAGTDAVKGR